MTDQFKRLATAEQLSRTIQALEANGITTVIVETGAEAKDKALSLIEKGASVMTATSTTANQIGLAEAIDNSKDFVSLRKKIMALPESEQRVKARRINSAPDYVVGSVHAVTENGQVIIASNSGSQLSPYAYSAAKVLWVVGTQKIVKDLDMAMRRIKEYTLGLESERLMQLYGIPSAIRKTLIINSEVSPDRITLIFVKERLGF